MHIFEKAILHLLRSQHERTQDPVDAAIIAEIEAYQAGPGEPEHVAGPPVPEPLVIRIEAPVAPVVPASIAPAVE